MYMRLRKRPKHQPVQKLLIVLTADSSETTSSIQMWRRETPPRMMQSSSSQIAASSVSQISTINLQCPSSGFSQTLTICISLPTLSSALSLLSQKSTTDLSLMPQEKNPGQSKKE